MRWRSIVHENADFLLHVAGEEERPNDSLLPEATPHDDPWGLQGLFPYQSGIIRRPEPAVVLIHAAVEMEIRLVAEQQKVGVSRVVGYALGFLPCKTVCAVRNHLPSTGERPGAYRDKTTPP